MYKNRYICKTNCAHSSIVVEEFRFCIFSAIFLFGFFFFKNVHNTITFHLYHIHYLALQDRSFINLNFENNLKLNIMIDFFLKKWYLLYLHCVEKKIEKITIYQRKSKKRSFLENRIRKTMERVIESKHLWIEFFIFRNKKKYIGRWWRCNIHTWYGRLSRRSINKFVPVDWLI